MGPTLQVVGSEWLPNLVACSAVSSYITTLAVVAVYLPRSQLWAQSSDSVSAVT